MANLGNLWFSVGLKDQTDADWEKIVKRVEQRGAKLGLTVDAQKLQSEINAAIANKKYTIDLSVAVKDNQVEAAIRNAYNRINGANATAADVRQSRIDSNYMRADAYSKAQAQLERSRRALAELREARLKDAEAARQQRAANDELSRTMVKTNSITSQLRNEILNVYSVYTIQNFLRSVIEIGGEFEKQRLALGSILQDAGHATELFSQIKNLAVISPFGIRELTNYAKQLAAFNIPYYELYDTTKRLADISAGVGVDMSRIILAYGQVRSAEFLKGTELRQFTEAGIPLVQALADHFTKLEGTAVSVGDVFDKIFKRQVSFEDVRKVLWGMTDEGGLFNNMQEVLSESLSGKWSNLKDAYDIMLADIAESNNAIAKGVIEGLTELMNNWEALVPVVFSAIGALGAYKAAMVSNNVLHGKENLELTRNALLLKQKQADVLRIAQTYRTLTAAEQGLLASSGKLSTAEYRQLAVSGQLTKEYALRLMALGRLKAGQAGHIAQVLQISKAEMAAALSASKWRVAMAGLAVSVRGLGVALKSMLFNPFTLVFAGLTVVMELYNSWRQKNDEMEQNVRDLAQKATEGYKRVHEQLKGFEGIDLGKVRSDSLVTSIEQIEETLKNYSPRYNDIQKEADGVSELTDRYRILLDALRETEEAYKMLEKYSPLAEHANKYTDGLFDESLKENIVDYSDALKESEDRLVTLSKYQKDISKAIQAAASKDNGFASAIAGKSFDEQVKIATSSYERFIDVANELAHSEGRNPWLYYYNGLDDLSRILNNKVIPDLNTFSETLKQSLEAKGVDFSNLTKDDEDAIRMLVRNYVDGITNATQEVRDWLSTQILTVRFKIKPVEDYQPELLIKEYGRLIESVSDNGLFTQKELSSVNDAASAYKLVSGRLKEAEENLASLNRVKADAMTPEQRGIYTAQLEAAEKEVDGYRKVREALFNEEQKEQKATVSGKDAVAERWKERLGLMKEAESEYRKWSELVGKDAAVEKLLESGLFGELGADFDFADARKEIARFVDEMGRGASTDAQRDVAREGLELIWGFRYDENKDGLDKALAEVQSYIDKQTGKWNLYKGLLGQTSDKELSFGIAFGGAFDEDLADFEAMMRRTFDEAMADKGLAYKYEELWLKGTEGIPKDVARLYENVKKEIDGYYEDEKKRLGEILGEYQSNREKIVKIEQEAAEKIALIRKQMASGAIGGAEGGAAINRIQGEADWEKFRMSSDYLQFYSSIFALTRREAENIGQAIRKNLDDQLRKGVLTAEEYCEEMENIDKQLEKIRGKKGIFGNLFGGGGLDGMLDELYEMGKSKANKGAEDFNKGSENLTQALGDWNTAMQAGDTQGAMAATQNAAAAQDLMNAGSSMMSAGQGMMAGASGAMGAVGVVDMIVHGINNMVQGLAGAFDKIKESMDALGKDTSLDSGIGKLAAGMSIFAEASQNATDAWDSLKSGDMGGVINGVVGSFTSWITGFARLHDAKLEEEIEKSRQYVRELQSVYDSVERVLSRTLGTGHDAYVPEAETYKELMDIYNNGRLIDYQVAYKKAGLTDMPSVFGFQAALKDLERIKELTQAYEEGGAYGYQRELLEDQYAELEKQRQLEMDKKDSDYTKIQDYEEQMAELRDQITYFAQDVAEELYNIDLKDWASQLGDALYEAWQNGEDGAEAFRNKAAEIIGDVMNQILKLQILEPAMQDISDYLFGTDEERAANGGKGGVFGTDFELDETEMKGLADRLLGMSEVSEEYTDMMEQLNDYLKQYGIDLKDLGSGTDGLAEGIQSITEDTAGTLASYLNAIRQDVSVKRRLIEQLVGDDFPQLSAMVQAQLVNLEMIARNTGANAESAAGILELLRRNVNGGNKFHFG